MFYGRRETIKGNAQYTEKVLWRKSSKEEGREYRVGGDYILNGEVREGLTEVTFEQSQDEGGRESMSICHQGF